MLHYTLMGTLLSLADSIELAPDPAVLLSVLTTASVQLLDVDAAAVLLIDEQGRLVPVAATHGSLDRIEQVQIDEHEGPCVDGTRGTAAVCSTDLDVDGQRWPAFSAVAREEGFRSVHTEPLSLRGTVVGTLNLFRRRTGPLSDDGHRDAGYLTAAAAIGLLQRRALHRVEAVNTQLRGALESRIEIEQAKGALAERHGLDPAAAFEMLRREARRRGVPVRQVARAVREGSPRAGT